ncbi:hypothetical protein [Solirubrobacter soli]|uniref:hypothetical protein n=1 Tax=Solirubrobacter soli TaxID=363832 RepID=UPI00041D5FD2|nr:hypothetical protein [Solirubrobacter soli]
MKTSLALAAALAIAAAPAAQAAGWKQVTAPNGSNIDQVSLVRTQDSVLHVAWHKGGDLSHTRIEPSGKIDATTPIQSGWASMSDPAIVAVPGGLRAFWGGIRTTDAGETNQDLNTAFSADGGASWQLQPGSIVPLGAQAYGSDQAASTLPDGTTLQSWAGTLGTWIHAGLDPATPNTNFQTTGGYGYDDNLATDASGATMLAWFSDTPPGIRAQAVAANGTPAGGAMTMPGTQVMVGGPELSRTPIVARPKGGGFYIARAVGYPTADQVRVWKVGAASAALLARTDSSAETAISTDAKGRLWVAWSDGSFGDKHVYVARSNETANRFGEPVDVGVVKDAHSVYTLDLSATGNSADVLAVFGVGTGADSSTYVKRVLPGLTLAAKRSGNTVTFTVTDAGDPVSGAKVKAGGKSATTASNGKVKLTLKSKTASQATKSGYAPATLKAR